MKSKIKTASLRENNLAEGQNGGKAERRYMKYILLYILCFNLFAVQGNAQDSMTTTSHVNMVITTPVDYQTLFSRQFDFSIPVKQSLMCQSAGTKNYPTLNHLPGLFCKLEYKIETKSKLAPRFRLGSLAYTEWMEGKRIW